MARLGRRVQLVTGFGTDPLASRLLAALAADGIELGSSWRVPRPTPLALAFLERGAASYLFYLEGTALADDAGPPAVERAAARASVLVTGGIALALDTPGEAIVAALERSCAAARIVDPNVRPSASRHPTAYRARLQRALAAADVIKASVEDLAWCFPGEEPQRAAAQLLDGGTAVVVVTDGPAPLRLWHRSGTATFPLESVRITDTVGAGDALTGALAAWIDRAQGTRSQLAHLVTEALPIAITVAQLTCQRRGADPPSAREVRNW